MSDHQPEYHDEDEHAEPARLMAQGAAAADPLEPDFSRLRLARASLDNAFPQE